MAVKFPLSVPIVGVDKLTAPLAKAGGALGRFGAKARSVGKGLTLGITLPAALAVGSIVKANVEFERSLAGVRAVSGATADEMAGLRTEAKRLGLQTKFTAGESAAGFVELGRAGFKAFEILEAGQPILDLAAAGNLELADTANIAAKGLRGYGLEAKDMPRITGLFASAQAAASQNLEEFGEAFKFGGPVAKAFGVELEDTAAILSQFANVGFTGSLGGNALSRSLSALAAATPGTDAGRELQKLGVHLDEIFDRDGKVRDFVGLLEQLSVAGIKPAQVFKIFDQRAAKPLMRVLEGGLGPVRELGALFRESLGEDARIAGIQMEGAAGAGYRLSASFEGLKISLGESGILDDFVRMADGLGAMFKSLSETNPGLLRTGTIVVGVAAVLGPLIWLLGQVAIGTLAVSKGVTIAAVAFKRFGLAMLTTPIGIAITAIGLLVAGVIQFVTAFREARAKGLSIGAALFEGLKSIFTGIADVVLFIPKLVISGLDAIFGGVKEFFRGLIDFLPDFVLDALGLLPTDTTTATVPAKGGFSAYEDELALASGRAEEFRRRFGDQSPPGEPGRGGEAKITVDFKNTPPGTRVRVGPTPLDLDVSQGLALSSL